MKANALQDAFPQNRLLLLLRSKVVSYVKDQLAVVTALAVLFFLRMSIFKTFVARQANQALLLNGYTGLGYASTIGEYPRSHHNYRQLHAG